jgi:hypothetical protein
MPNRYGRPSCKAQPIPSDLALLMIRKASRMAYEFENKALDTMSRDVHRALRDGTDPRVIIRQMEL